MTPYRFLNAASAICLIWAAQSGTMRAENSECPLGVCAHAEQVRETPKGIIDGRNTVFVVNNVVDPNSPVNVFVDGLQLQSSEYMVRGRALMFVAGSAPAPGDMVKVFYTPAMPQHGLSPEKTIRTLPGSDGIANAAAQQALISEERDGSRSAELGFSAQSRGSARGVSEPDSGAGFLRMLSEKSGSSVNANRRQTSVRAVLEVDGVDGMGDRWVEDHRLSTEASAGASHVNEGDIAERKSVREPKPKAGTELQMLLDGREVREAAETGSVTTDFDAAKSARRQWWRMWP